MNPFKTRFFKHYKNKPYKFLQIVRHSETLEEMALYETLYENKQGRLWVRPKAMFFEKVNIEGKEVPRFAPIEFTFKNFTQFNAELLADIKIIYKSCFNVELNESFFKSKLQAHSEFHILLAYEDTTPVGMKIGYKIDQHRFYSWQGGVVPEYQGLGVASEMFRLQDEWCRKQYFKVIETRTRNPYKQMIKLNLQNDFQIIGTVSDKKGIKIIFEKVLS